jgi:hypothetical protein
MGCSQSKPVASSTAVSPASKAATAKAQPPAAAAKGAAAATANPKLALIPQALPKMMELLSNGSSTHSRHGMNGTNGTSTLAVTAVPTVPAKPPSLHWTLVVWKQLEEHLLDPADVPSVISARKNFHINRLGSTELVMIQRRVRQITAQLPKTAAPNKNMIARFTNASAAASGESRGLMEKYHQLDETVVRRMFAAGDALWRDTCVEWKSRSKTPTSLNIFANLFTLLAHLSSEALMDRTTAIAVDSATRAGLERDVNKYNAVSLQEAPTVPGLTQYAQDEPEGVIGASLTSICCCMGLGLRKFHLGSELWVIDVELRIGH